MYNREDRYAPHYEPIVRRLLVNEIIDRETNSFHCSTASSLAEKFIEAGRLDEAWETMETIIPLIIKEEEWFLYGLGRTIITTCIHIILHFGAESLQASSLWQTIKGILQPAANHMGTDQYQLAVSASKFMGDTELEQRLIRLQKQRQ